MSILLALLNANNKLLNHAARELEHATREGRFFARPDHLHNEHIFLKTYLALREVEIRGLHLLHEVTVLAQLLHREEAARKAEQQMEKNYKAQEQGNGKKTVIISRKDLKKQEKVVTKDRKLVKEHVDDTVVLFLAQHEALVQANRLFQELNARVVLLHPRTDRAILKTYARAGGSTGGLIKHVRGEVERAVPLDLADDLLARRSTMRHRLTVLGNTRREFAEVIHQHFPLVGAP